MKQFLILLVISSARDVSARRRVSSTNGTMSIRDFYNFTDNLFAADINGAGNLIQLDLQNKTTARSFQDVAPNPLFGVASSLNELLTRPTYAALIAMFDNYELAVNQTEVVTEEETAEEERFLDAVMATDIMKTAHKFLVSKGRADPDASSFRQYLREIWFGAYSRARGVPGSSGFEHVFVGELKGNISGMHSWVRYYTEEKEGNMNYLGYIKTAQLGPNLLLELPFSWKSAFKPISSILVGASPELEMAIYTVCYRLFPNKKCPLKVNETVFKVQTFTLENGGKKFIGTAYPTL